MRHPVCPGQRRVSSRHTDGVTRSRFGAAVLCWILSTGKLCCSLAVLALDSSISLYVSPERAVGVTALFCLHLCSGTFAVDTEASAREGNFAVLAVCARTQWILSLRQQTLVVKKGLCRSLSEFHADSETKSGHEHWYARLGWTGFGLRAKTETCMLVCVGRPAASGPASWRSTCGSAQCCTWLLTLAPPLSTEVLTWALEQSDTRHAPPGPSGCMRAQARSEPRHAQAERRRTGQTFAEWYRPSGRADERPQCQTQTGRATRRASAHVPSKTPSGAQNRDRRGLDFDGNVLEIRSSSRPTTESPYSVVGMSWYALQVSTVLGGLCCGIFPGFSSGSLLCLCQCCLVRTSSSSSLLCSGFSRMVAQCTGRTLLLHMSMIFWTCLWS